MSRACERTDGPDKRSRYWQIARAPETHEEWERKPYEEREGLLLDWADIHLELYENPRCCADRNEAFSMSSRTLRRIRVNQVHSDDMDFWGLTAGEWNQKDEEHKAISIRTICETIRSARKLTATWRHDGDMGYGTLEYLQGLIKRTQNLIDALTLEDSKETAIVIKMRRLDAECRAWQRRDHV